MTRRGWWAVAGGFGLLAVVGAVAAGLGAVQQALGWTGAVAAAVGSVATTLAGVLAGSLGRPEPRDARAGRLPAGLLFLVRGRAPRVGDVPAARLGVKAAVGTGGDQLPPYVSRDVDADLAEAVRAGGLVLVHGPAAAGKSRTAFEALRAVSGRRLYVPDPDRPDVFAELMRHGESLRDAVVWLDDIDRYLVPGGLDLTVLDWLCPPGRSDVVVLATIREQARLDRGRGPDSGRASLLHPAGDDVLWAARADFALDRGLSPAERGRAGKVGDKRVREALDDAGAGFGEALAAGPQLLSRWQIGAGQSGVAVVGAAVVAAAVDLRRAGYLRPVAESVLAEAYDRYLPANLQHHPDRPSFADGLRWAREVICDTTACLLSVSGGRYLAHDYLVDQTQSGHGPLAGRAVTTQVWQVLTAAAWGEHLYEVGVVAYLHGRLAEAETAFRRCATEDSPAARDAMFALGVLGREQQDSEGAERWWRDAAERGHAAAMLCLCVVAAAGGDTRTSVSWYMRASTATTIGLTHQLGSVVTTSEVATGTDHAGTARWWIRVAGTPILDALQRIGDALRDRGLHAQAQEWWRSAAQAGHQPSMVALAASARAGGVVADAQFWYGAAVDANPRDVSSLRTLGIIGLERGGIGDAEQWLSRAADLGDGQAMMELAHLCRRRRDWPGTAGWLLKAGGVHFADWLQQLQGLLAEPEFTVTPDLADDIAARLLPRYKGNVVAPWLRIAANGGISAAQVDLAVILYGGSDAVGARHLLLTAAETGDPDAMYNCGRISEADGDVATARGWYARAAALGDTESADRLTRIRGAADMERGTPQLRFATRTLASA